MRIRKRQVPLPLSSLSPVPLSDLRLDQPPPPPVQLHHHYDTTHPKPSQPDENSDRQSFLVHSQPSDRPNQCLPLIGGGRDGPDFSGSGGEQKEVEEYSLDEMGGRDQKVEEGKRGGEQLGEKSNDTRKGISILGAEVGGQVLPQSGSSSQVGRWCEGEKAFPLKKRRGSFEKRVIGEKADIKMKSKMKTKMNKKCVVQNEDDEQGKKRGRGGAVMEGSRCSRVNGRGWRCCQQTLVGYSLCEHHLGKGRLRSMSSVRSRSLAAAAAATKDNENVDHDDKFEPLISRSSLKLQEGESKCCLLGGGGDDDNEERKPLMMTKKRMKLGMVKARSINSLLQGEAKSANSVADNNK